MLSRLSRDRPSSIVWFFVGGFAIVVSANLVLVGFSLSSWTGIETEAAYLEGLAYNERLAVAEMQAARGWRSAIGFESTGPAQGVLSASLHDAKGAALSELVAEAALVRPTHEGFDRTVDLDENAPGVYDVAVEFPLSGVWEVRLKISGAGAPYYASQRIWVSP